MKRTAVVASLVLASCLLQNLSAQGTLVFDQQTSDDESPPGRGSGLVWGSNGFGQSFTPTFDRIDFVRWKLGESRPGAIEGTTFIVNLRSGSITGNILASTDPVVLPQGFLGVAHFSFGETVALTPGTTYYLEPRITSSLDFAAPWNFSSGEYWYLGGSGYVTGLPIGNDFWFREGFTVVPEPSSACLALLGLGGLAWRWRARKASRR